jgi:hypothetical protein
MTHLKVCHKATTISLYSHFCSELGNQDAPRLLADSLQEQEDQQVQE